MVYGAAIREALARIDCDDVPKNGVYVLGAIARAGAPMSEIVRQLGVSKQAAGQLVDTLVLRGYLDRAVDPEDRRRLTITLSERGRAAAAASRDVVDGIEADLAQRVGAQAVAHTRATLLALIESGRVEHA
ncbi:MAG TPA: MarR family transcriptional regulator [Acetobacteraceae bacterium]|nr:MarR family transcriptional regulator [Acetobacteraceae bacterium]